MLIIDSAAAGRFELDSAERGLFSALIWLMFFNDTRHLSSLNIAVNRCSSLPNVPY
jgi:hypothetical protein